MVQELTLSSMSFAVRRSISLTGMRTRHFLIENALSPAKVVVVLADVEEKTAKVVVPDYQLSLAIGKEGQNARLAARLTGFKIDIKSESQANAIEGFYEGFYDEDEDEEEAYDENEYAEGTVEDENAEE